MGKYRINRFLQTLKLRRVDRQTSNASPQSFDALALTHLELVKKSVLNEIHLDNEMRLLYLRSCLNGDVSFDAATYHDIRSAIPDNFKKLKASRQIGQFYDRKVHNAGFSHSMMGRARLDSLHFCLDHVRVNNIPGDVAECGVWRGGGCIFMAAYLQTYSMTGRQVIVADSFEGLPKPSHANDQGMDLSRQRFPQLAVSLETVKDNFSAYGLLSDNVVFLKGWFKDTLRDMSSQSLALLRLDGDLYESTMDSLVALYDKVEPGGVVIVDDYGAIKSCRQAVADFFNKRGQPVPAVTKIDWTGVYWIKDQTEFIRTKADGR